MDGLIEEGFAGNTNIKLISMGTQCLFEVTKECSFDAVGGPLWSGNILHTCKQTDFFGARPNANAGPLVFGIEHHTESN
jgi:hypothetical protein